MPESKPTIVVLGSLNMDLIGVAPRLPAPGETIRGESFYTAPGGKGGNQAVAASKLGANVRMVGRVGKDTFGESLLSDLRGHGIDVSGVAQDLTESTGIAIILLDSLKQNYIVVVGGANLACGEQELEAAKRAMDGADALMLQLEVPVELSLEAARYAKSRGIRVFWDPAPARELPDEVFVVADVITPNQIEAEALTGVAVKDVASAQEAADALLNKGVSVAVVKMGEDGVFFATKVESGFVLPFSVDAVDTVAAGDAFGAALSVALSEGVGLSDAVRFGAAAGALAVTKPGAQDAMPSRFEVEDLLG